MWRRGAGWPRRWRWGSARACTGPPWRASDDDAALRSIMRGSVEPAGTVSRVRLHLPPAESESATALAQMFPPPDARRCGRSRRAARRLAARSVTTQARRAHDIPRAHGWCGPARGPAHHRDGAADGRGRPAGSQLGRSSPASLRARYARAGVLTVTTTARRRAGQVKPSNRRVVSNQPIPSGGADAGCTRNSLPADER